MNELEKRIKTLKVFIETQKEFIRDGIDVDEHLDLLEQFSIELGLCLANLK